MLAACGHDHPAERAHPPARAPSGDLATVDAGKAGAGAPARGLNEILDGDAGSCPVKARWSLRLRQDRAPYAIEWRQCGNAVHGTVGEWDVDYLAVHELSDTNGAIVWSTTNAADPTERWLEEVVPTHFGPRDGAQLFVLTRVAGTGHGWELCELGAVGSGIGCWAEPDDLQKRFALVLLAGESTRNCQVSLDQDGLQYRCGIARPGDANCCPSGGELRASAVASDRSFVLGRVWRTHDR